MVIFDVLRSRRSPGHMVLLSEAVSSRFPVSARRAFSCWISALWSAGDKSFSIHSSLDRECHRGGALRVLWLLLEPGCSSGRYSLNS